MRVVFCLMGLTALVAAAPRPQSNPPFPISVSASIASPTVPIVASTSLNIPVTTPSAFPTGIIQLNETSTSRRRKSHWEPIPIFSRSCDCPKLETVAYPCWATDALQRCEFEENHSWICWTSAAFGCPSPTRECEDLFSPTPLTGPYPCGPVGFAPEPTTAPAIGF